MWEAKRRLGIARAAVRHAADPSLPHFLINFHAPLWFTTHSISSTPSCEYQRIPFLSLPFHLHFSLFSVPCLSIIAMADIFTQVEEFSIHDGQSIDVVYTNDLAEVQMNLDMYERMLEGWDPQDRFWG